MNILVVSGQWTTEPKAGGVQSNVCTLVDTLSKNHAVTVFTPRWRKETMTREGVGPVCVYGRRIRSAEGRSLFALRACVAWLLDLPRALGDLRQVFRERQIEVMHLHQLQANQLTFAVARALGGPPYVATFHGRDVRDYKRRPWIERLAIRQIVRFASGLTAVSQELATLAESEIPGAKDVLVIRNGVSIDDLTVSAAVPRGLPSKYLLAVGRLYPLDGFALKGQDLIIRAWSRLQVAKPDLHLLLAGADDERRGYESLAETCGVSSQVHILGSMPRPQLLAIMAGAIGIVTASRSEGGGPTMTVLEAGSFARPLIASSIPAHTEFLECGVDSLLVPPEDPESIASAVLLLVNDPALATKLGKALQEKVRATGSAEQMCERYVRAAYAPALQRKTATLRSSS